MTDTMQGLLLHAVGSLRLEAVPKPVPGPGEALIRIGFCGVCGSDIPRIFVKGAYSFPLICGHEFAGTVDALGDGVQDVGVGDRVAVFPLLWCGTCPACEEGKYVQCADYDYLGSRSDGGFAEYVVAPTRNLVVVPDDVSLEDAAMTEPAAVALHALKRAGGTSPGETVVIFGAGPIGLMAAQWARAMGASQVIVLDLVPEKLAMSRALGFELSFDVRARDAVDIINDLTSGQGADLCIEGAGVPPTFVQALTATRRGGRTVILGNPAGDVTLPASLISQLMRREVTVCGTWNSQYSACGCADDWRTSLEAMSNAALVLKPLVTHIVSLADAEAALVMMHERSEFFSKVLIQPAT
jgi:L-iditol 2-dehydrogenase